MIYGILLLAGALIGFLLSEVKKAKNRSEAARKVENDLATIKATDLAVSTAALVMRANSRNDTDTIQNSTESNKKE